MKVLVIGSGGREHTLCWKIAQSDRLSKLYCAPGNAGIAQIATLVDIAADDLLGIKEFCQKELIDLVVVGPEVPLTLGLADILREEGISVIGPDKNGAELEASKIFSKAIMDMYNIPTAKYKIFDDPSLALKYIAAIKYPVVIKADGLAAGKGVIIANNIVEAESAINTIMVDKIFKESGNRIVIEDFLQGEEASILAFVDGTDYIPMITSQDHKRAFNNDMGPNTGGMGAYSPAPVITEELFSLVDKIVLKPTVEGLHKEGINFQGILYAGLIITEKGPQVLEYNVRFGDPETQVVLPRLKTDIIDIFEAMTNHTLSKINIEWDDRAALCVVMASGGYPGSYNKGEIINGLNEATKISNAYVFHAGTKMEGSTITTNGGRVLGVTGLGNTIQDAYNKAYEAVDTISFKDMQFRTDIGYKALERLNEV